MVEGFYSVSKTTFSYAVGEEQVCLFLILRREDLVQVLQSSPIADLVRDYPLLGPKVCGAS